MSASLEYNGTIFQVKTNAYRDAHGLQGSDDIQVLRETLGREAAQMQSNMTRGSMFNLSY